MGKTVRLYEKKGETSIFIDAGITDAGDLQISGQDIGEAPKKIFGDIDYEYWLTVRSEHKDRVLLALIERMFLNNPSVVSEFQGFLKAKGIPCEFDSYV